MVQFGACPAVDVQCPAVKKVTTTFVCSSKESLTPSGSQGVDVPTRTGNDKVKRAIKNGSRKQNHGIDDTQ